MKRNTKKLVIHPRDKSTVFLNRVYENLDNVTVVQGDCDKTQLKEMITEHDQVLMMGHGTPHGLLGGGQFDAYGSIIDDSFADLLAEKDDSVFIWCNADQYVNWNGLRGFHTGMFISETGEASMCGIPFASQDEVDESNNAFVDIVSDAIGGDSKSMYRNVRRQYGQLVSRNRVAKYNHERLYV